MRFLSTVAECVCVCKQADGSWGWGSVVGNQGQEELAQERSEKGMPRTVSAWTRECPALAQLAKKPGKAIEPLPLPGRRASLRAAVLESCSPANRTQLRIAHRSLPFRRLSRGRKRIQWEPATPALPGSPEPTVLFSQDFQISPAPGKISESRDLTPASPASCNTLGPILGLGSNLLGLPAPRRGRRRGHHF